ncbi:hypothetical protein G6O69_34440 [Pseudenhygromyxa sp. WMMC2535]|uniref:hypothetical protein n=1 Tax=Pseudenhygromyxa sp. WMMC2535 TaxID=2712867 RepID=UPI001553FADB|nr:hypothetical protein [Pseudenhygromyxa sp. WMMC2535]NVB42972.1 hypothetical protein [Pseudenhygromyxa sp. WMMC2535]
MSDPSLAPPLLSSPLARTGLALRGTGFALRGIGFALRGTGFALRGTGFALRGIGCRGLAIAAVLAGVVALAPAWARAGDPPEPEPYTPTPTLHLQPESARLILDLPPELLPPPDLGAFGRPLDPNVHWDFGDRVHPARASLGAGLQLSVDDRRRNLHFQFSLLPRAAVVVLRFDPVAPLLR